MTVDVRHRVVVVTGASRGLGAGLARHFLAKGMHVAACARTLPDLPVSDRAFVAVVDVTDATSVSVFCDQVAHRFGTIDLWINNAGVLTPIGPLRNNASDEFARHIQVNLLGVFYGSRAYIRHLHDRNATGTLINISSGAARNAYAGWSAYCASKAAVERMTECIALEEHSTGLRAYAVAPGIVDTDMQTLIRQCTPEQFPAVRKFLDLKQKEQFSTPEFVAEHLLKLAFASNQEPPHPVLVTLPREH